MPLAEAQGEWLADYLRGRYALPTQGELAADIRDDQQAMHKRYLASKRHTIQVDFEDYLWNLDKEREARRRARGGARVCVAGAPSRQGPPAHRERGGCRVTAVDADPTAAVAGKRERTKQANRTAILRRRAPRLRRHRLRWHSPCATSKCAPPGHGIALDPFP